MSCEMLAMNTNPKNATLRNPGAQTNRRQLRDRIRTLRKSNLPMDGSEKRTLPDPLVCKRTMDDGLNPPYQGLRALRISRQATAQVVMHSRSNAAHRAQH